MLHPRGRVMLPQARAAVRALVADGQDMTGLFVRLAASAVTLAVAVFLTLVR